jgi:signal transduction histidine kinase
MDARACAIRDDRAMRSPQPRLDRLADIAIPSGVGLFLVLIVLEESERLSSPLVVLGVILGIVQGAALRWRRRRPEPVMAVAVAGGLGTLLLAPETVLPIAGYFAMWSLAVARPRRVSLLGLAGLEAVAASNLLIATVEDPLGDTGFAMAVGVGVWALGDAARNRRAAIDEAARRAVGEEQARIARELHDVIAHSVSMIVVQAAAADDVFDSRPDQARAALRSIERAGRDALGELRRLLSAVRPGVEPEPTGPQPGLDRLDELAEPLRAGGLRVVVRREGPATQLPAGVDLSAYRIVQEALTNTVRHARATRAEVTVRYGSDAVEVDVRDDGRASPGSAANGGGHGLAGMRERASLLGGTLEAGPLPGGGYRVHARLPLEPAR